MGSFFLTLTAAKISSRKFLYMYMYIRYRTRQMQGITRFACQMRLPQTLNAFSAGAKCIYCKRKMRFLEALNAFTLNVFARSKRGKYAQSTKVGVTTHVRYRLGRDVTVGVAWARDVLYCGVEARHIGWPRPTSLLSHTGHICTPQFVKRDVCKLPPDSRYALEARTRVSHSRQTWLFASVHASKPVFPVHKRKRVCYTHTQNVFAKHVFSTREKRLL